MIRVLLAAASLLVLSSAALAQGDARPAASDGPRPRCSAISLPDLPVCVETPGGLIFAPDRAEAERNAAHAMAGEIRFRRHFDRAPPPYAVVIGRLTPEVGATLRRAGINAALPWLTVAQRQAAVADAARRAAEARAKAQNLDAAKTAELVQQMTAATAGRTDRDAGVVPHELGHLWLIESFWPGSGADRKGHYGGPAADWLDETAAILMEDERLTTERRDQFRQLYAGKAGGPPALGGRPDFLPVFLSKDHPMKGEQEASKARAPGSPGEARVIVTTRDERAAANPGADAGAGPRFYLQGRAFADFLIDRSGEPAIFAEIAAALARGRTFEQWLAAEGARRGLGSTLPEMDQLWRAWLLARFGPPAPAARSG